MIPFRLVCVIPRVTCQVVVGRGRSRSVAGQRSNGAGPRRFPTAALAGRLPGVTRQDQRPKDKASGQGF